MEQTTISILSLTVAALAVFVGPVVSWLITRRQLESAERIANRQIIGPIRQAWIADLRVRVAELIASALHYAAAGFEDRPEQDYQRLTRLEQEVTLMLSPDMEPSHEALLKALREMVGAIEQGKPSDHPAFYEAHQRATALGRDVLRAEWRRVKLNV